MESINEILETCPIVLDSENIEVQKLGLQYLPYSTGFEIECEPKDKMDENLYKSLGLLHLDMDNSEQRFRITNGIEGLKQLYNICNLLPKTMHFNLESGIHYHIDCTDVWDDLNTDIIENLSEYILRELDSWNYQGTYNPRKCIFNENRNWTRFKLETKTMEFRIGEMSFEYETLFKRIVHCNKIVKLIKNATKNTEYLLDFMYNYNKNDLVKNRIIKL